jgi:hypothetical protein
MYVYNEGQWLSSSAAPSVSKSRNYYNIEMLPELNRWRNHVPEKHTDHASTGSPLTGCSQWRIAQTYSATNIFRCSNCICSMACLKETVRTSGQSMSAAPRVSFVFVTDRTLEFRYKFRFRIK